MNHHELTEQAKKILAVNDQGGFTVPTSRLYPFQWNWDSGFTAIGWSHIDLQWAIQEMEQLFSGQWENGMLPHIIFHSETETTYFPNHPFWGTDKVAAAPKKPKTSGISQPPVHGFVVEQIFQKGPQNTEVQAFTKSFFHKLKKLHRFYYEYRDPKQEHLAYVFHPWETGRDNSPLWDDILKKIELQPGDIPPYKRQDNKVGKEAERPTDFDYDRYVYLLELGKKYDYVGTGITDESPYLVQDTLFNSVLLKSNESLIHLGQELGLDTSEIEEWQQEGIRNFEAKMWNETLGMYVPYDLRYDGQIAYREVGGLTPLAAKIPSEKRAVQLDAYLQDLLGKGYLLCPSFDVESLDFISNKYWRGPIWAPTNWLVWEGLKNYEMTTADTVRKHLLDLVNQLGFYEYFDSQPNINQQLMNGYGGDNFSWTAAVILDFLKRG